MITKRYCDSGRQECPTEYDCQTGCYFNEATTKTCPPCTGGCDQGRACNAPNKFWDASPPGHYEMLDKPLRGWSLAFEIALVVAVIAGALVIALVTTGVWL